MNSSYSEDGAMKANSVPQPVRPKPGSKWIWGLAVITVFAIGVGAWYVAFINPLPSDEEMMTHFQGHRADIEALVKSYREYQSLSDDKSRLWVEASETKALMQKAGVKYVNDAGSMWFPNPYSVETARQAEDLRRKMGTRVFDLYRRYSSLYVRLADPRYFTKLLRYPTSKAIWKDFYHIPEVAKIEDGMLLGSINVDGRSSLRYRVFASLNSYPPAWKQGECVLRRIDPHWYIEMCRAA